MRAWARTPRNDPFAAASQELAGALHQETSYEVIVGYNEFCGPSVDEALDAAVARGAERVLVTTPMLTRGGEHAERDIPESIGAAQKRHPAAMFQYAWPFDSGAIAQFLSSQLHRFVL